MNWKNSFPIEQRFFETANGILYCEDNAQILQKFREGSVSFVLTDPPYNINYKLKTTKIKRVGHNGIQNDNMKNEDFLEFLSVIFAQIDRVLQDDAFCFVFSGKKVHILMQAMENTCWNIQTVCVWKKNTISMGYYYRSQHELFVLATKGHPERPKKTHSNVWEVARTDYIQEKTHTCEKPILLLQQILQYYTKDGDIVLDPFFGSGTTAIAVEMANKQRDLFGQRKQLRWIGIEIDPSVCEHAKNKIKKYL